MRAALLTSLALILATPVVAKAEPVLLISIDGLRPGDVLEAQQRGLRLPNLSRFVSEGSFASGVTGVLPTVTYPSHTTLLTGTSPAKHGVVSNTTFDPYQINHDGWFWFAEDIKVPTLWSVASKAGLKTANVHWPVSVAAQGITWNLPQIWRTGHGDDAKLIRALTTPGLVSQLERETSETYATGIAEDIAADENRGRFAVRLISDHHPDFISVYLTGLDHEQHLAGPGTPAAHAVLERIDAIVGKLVEAELKARPDGVIAVASDHGFAPINRQTNLFRPFIDAGLISLDDKGKVSGWEAMPWNSGGSAAIVLARPDDLALQAKVRSLLSQLKTNPEVGIAAIIETDTIAKQRGNPQASFFIDFNLGTTTAGFAGADAPLTSIPKYKGMHGYFPSHPEMRSTFMVMGKGVAKARSLGEIDMRSIAPTLARVLGVTLADAEQPPLPISAKP